MKKINNSLFSKMVDKEISAKTMDLISGGENGDPRPTFDDKYTDLGGTDCSDSATGVRADMQPTGSEYDTPVGA